MGSAKQLADLGGRPLLEHALAALAGAKLDRVVVALGAGSDRILAGVDLHGAEPFVATRWAEGMGAVLAEAVAGPLAGASAVVLTLGDQPFVTAAVADRLVEAWAGGAGPVVGAAYDGRAGHPRLFDASLLPELARLRGDEGARALLAGHPELVTLVECGGLGDDLDVDDADGLARARARLAGT
jgi:nicotine blue oxidoreductase